MDAFVTRKKRKCGDSILSVSAPAPAPASQATTQPSTESSSEESTDVKLAILSSFHPTIEQETLLDILLAHDGDVEATSRTLKARLPRKPGMGGTVAAQSSLRSFAVNSAGSELHSQPKRVRLLSRKGATLHLYDPVDISEHTPCTIIHNFLPVEEMSVVGRREDRGRIYGSCAGRCDSVCACARRGLRSWSSLRWDWHSR